MQGVGQATHCLDLSQCLDLRKRLQSGTEPVAGIQFGGNVAGLSSVAPAKVKEMITDNSTCWFIGLTDDNTNVPSSWQCLVEV